MERLLSRMVESVRAFARARPRLASSAVAVAAVVLVIGGPGYLASRPEFFERYRSTEKYYSSWSRSTHAEVICERCHLQPGRMAQVLYRARMLAEFYLGLVTPARALKVFGKPPTAACKSCHYTGRAASPSGDLRIPHRAHVDVLKLSCIRCHKWVVHFKNPEGRNSPRMATCLVCHDGRQATRECTACHKRKSFPVSHRARDWLVVHGEKQKEIECGECHGWVPRFCRACHSQRPLSHNGRWRTFHGLRVAGNRNCEVCHRPEFCVRCHGEVPRLNISRAPKFVN